MQWSNFKLQGWKKEHVLHKFEDGSRILVVIPDEKLPMKKVKIE